MHDSDGPLPSFASPVPSTEPASPAAAGSGFRNPAGYQDCACLSGERRTARLAGDHSKATDYTVLLRRHWRSVHRA
ncbi:hypothetical protein AF335_09695 [Streptomyces eurocidicus]|nr:hypothetical protein AF335_09695 [Streptomyces eurocidicus]